MNCKETKPLLTTYLNGEVSQSEKEFIQTHLATCVTCKEDLKELAVIGDLLRDTFHLQTETVQPSAHAFQTLQIRIVQEQKRSVIGPMYANLQTVQRGLAKRSQSSRRLGIVVIVLALLVLLSPPVWALAARVGEWLVSFYTFKVPDASGSIGGFDAFTPFTPTYLPRGFNSIGIGFNTTPDVETLELTFSKRDRFVTILQSNGENLFVQPEGRKISINGQDGISISNFANSIEDLRLYFPEVSAVTDFDYSEINFVAWSIGDVRLVLLTNMPVETALEIARSLVPMQGSAEPKMERQP